MNPRNRLRTTRDFARATRSGVRAAAGSVAVSVYARDDDGPTRVGVTAGRSFGSAVARNRAKRRLKEAARLRLDVFPAASDVVIAGRQGVLTKNFQEIEADVERALARAAGTAR